MKRERSAEIQSKIEKDRLELELLRTKYLSSTHPQKKQPQQITTSSTRHPPSRAEVENIHHQMRTYSGGNDDVIYGKKVGFSNMPILDDFHPSQMKMTFVPHTNM